MERKERKILIEVSEEEYEKIKAGALEENVPTYEDVRKDVLEKLSDKDAKIIISNHYNLFMDNIDDVDLVAQIIRRSQDKSQSIYEHDAMSNEESVYINGTLRISKRDYSQINEPLVESRDTLTWHLKSFDDWGRKADN